MNEILGLIDALEAMVVEGKNVPFTGNVVLKEDLLLSLIEKVRLAIKSDGDVIREAFSRPLQPSVKDQIPISTHQESRSEGINETKLEHIAKEEKEIHSLRVGAEVYASNVLAELQLTVARMQAQLIKTENVIANGREMIENKQTMTKKGHTNDTTERTKK